MPYLNQYTQTSDTLLVFLLLTLSLELPNRKIQIFFKDVESWLETQPAYTKCRRIKVKYPHHKVLSTGLRYQYQADLVNYSALKRDNHSFTFLLTIIDIFSRFALAIPIKSKKGPHVTAALEKAFKVMKPPRKLQTDMGKEFYNSHVKRVLNRYRVHHFYTDQPLKAQIVEHFNRQNSERDVKSVNGLQKSLDYISFLSDLCMVTMLDITQHFFHLLQGRSIKIMKPRSMNYSMVNISDSKKAKHKYSIGDHVRKAKYRRFKVKYPCII